MPGSVRYDTPLVRLDVTRRVSPDSNIGVALGHTYSDAADAFRIVQAVGGATINTQPVVAAAAPFVDNYATFAWNFKYLRTLLDLSVDYYRNRYRRMQLSTTSERCSAHSLRGRSLPWCNWR